MTQDLSCESIELAISQVWQYLCAAQEPIRSDLIFVFGGLDLAVPEHAASLFLEGFGSKVLITGNVGKLTKDRFQTSEAEVFQQRMIDKGVPSTAILIETSATNTLENVVFGRQIIRSAGLQVQSALLVAKPFLMRRCKATFAKHWPNVASLNCPPLGSYDKFVDRPLPDFISRLIAELDRLRLYGQKGDIELMQIPSTVAAAEGILRSAQSDLK